MRHVHVGPAGLGAHVGDRQRAVGDALLQVAGAGLVGRERWRRWRERGPQPPGDELAALVRPAVSNWVFTAL